MQWGMAVLSCCRSPRFLPSPTTSSSFARATADPFGVNYSNPGSSVRRKQSLISLIKVKYDPFLCLRILLLRLRESSFLCTQSKEMLHQERGWGPQPGQWEADVVLTVPRYTPISPAPLLVLTSEQQERGALTVGW